MPVTIGGSGPITGVTSINTSVSDTELGYLDGVTSALQTQINAKANDSSQGLYLITPTSIANSGGSASASGGSVTFSGVSSVSLNGVFSTTFDAYRVVVDAVSSTATTIRLRWRVSGTDNSTASSYSFYNIQGTGSATSSSTGTTDSTTMTDIQDTACLFTFEVYGPALARRTNYLCTEISLGTGTDYIGLFGGSHNQATAYDGFTLFTGTGTTTGTVRVYGYRN